MLTDRVILICGLANERSLATACARACAAQGARIVGTWQDARRAGRAAPLLASIQADALGCELAVEDPAALSALAAAIGERHGRLDGIVHSIAFARLAAEGRALGVAGVDRARFSEALEISVRSLCALVTACDPLLSTGARICTLSYEGAHRVHPGYDLMGVAKAALEAAVRYLAHELGPRAIGVNAVSAGSLKTLAASGVPGAEERRQRAAARAPLRRNVTAEEVAAAVAFLLAPPSSGITGQILAVDAGLSIMGC